jgi:GNAT superfamily N-acetyltransferase
MIKYRYADENDVNLLVSLRLLFIKVAQSDGNYLDIERSTKEYFISKLSSGECEAILVENEYCVIGTGIIFYYDSVPSVTNVAGKNAYIACMYVDEQHRRQGIGTIQPWTKWLRCL